MWRALGEYRGPQRARAFMRYALEFRMDEARGEAFRVYVTEAIAALTGAERCFDLFHQPDDFDAGSVVDSVIARAGLGVI